MKKIVILLLILTFAVFTNSFLFAAGSGDVNNDGKIDIIDALMVAQYSVGITPPGFISANGDVNSDGIINIIDALMIAQMYVNGSGSETKILIPHASWPCGMPEGIPRPENGTLVFEVTMQLDQIYNIGKTQYGQRQAIIIKSGTISSTKVNGSIQSGGLDFQLNLSNGAIEIEQLLVIRTSAGNYIFMRNAGTAANQSDVRMVFDFEAPSSGSDNWLNSGKYAGRRVIDTTAGTMKISVYDISGISVIPDANNSITVTKPADILYQSWNYRIADPAERKGNQFIIESVALGSSQSVGTTKRGNRNIIPITGGDVTGNITARILAAGADYQNLSNPMTIDARYLWQTNDGEIIIVRNGGQFGSLVPTFEVRAASQYASLNKNLYLSSDPGMGTGGVQITFYESVK